MPQLETIPLVDVPAEAVEQSLIERLTTMRAQLTEIRQCLDDAHCRIAELAAANGELNTELTKLRPLADRNARLEEQLKAAGVTQRRKTDELLRLHGLLSERNDTIARLLAAQSATPEAQS